MTAGRLHDFPHTLYRQAAKKSMDTELFDKNFAFISENITFVTTNRGMVRLGGE